MVDHEGNRSARHYIDGFKTNSGCTVNEDCRRKLFRDKTSPGHGLQNSVHKTGRPGVLLILSKSYARHLPSAMHSDMHSCTASFIGSAPPAKISLISLMSGLLLINIFTPLTNRSLSTVPKLTLAIPKAIACCIWSLGIPVPP